MISLCQRALQNLQTLANRDECTHNRYLNDQAESTDDRSGKLTRNADCCRPARADQALPQLPAVGGYDSDGASVKPVD